MPGAIAERILKWLLAPSVGLLVLFAVFGRPRRKKAESRRQTAEGRRQEALPSGNSPYVGSLVYFAALGFGFIAVELALLQNLTLLVGHPILHALGFAVHAVGVRRHRRGAESALVDVESVCGGGDHRRD